VVLAELVELEPQLQLWILKPWLWLELELTRLPIFVYFWLQQQFSYHNLALLFLSCFHLHPPDFLLGCSFLHQPFLVVLEIDSIPRAVESPCIFTCQGVLMVLQESIRPMIFHCGPCW
jgi:hypothetical protein